MSSIFSGSSMFEAIHGAGGVPVETVEEGSHGTEGTTGSGADNGPPLNPRVDDLVDLTGRTRVGLSPARGAPRGSVVARWGSVPGPTTPLW